MQTWEPETVIKTILDEVESLIGEIIKMIQSCCDVFQSPENHTNAIQLSHGLSLRKLRNFMQNCSVCTFHSVAITEIYSHSFLAKFRESSVFPKEITK